jgi:hypothetical protein
MALDTPDGIGSVPPADGARVSSNRRNFPKSTGGSFEVIHLLHSGMMKNPAPYPKISPRYIPKTLIEVSETVLTGFCQAVA